MEMDWKKVADTLGEMSDHAEDAAKEVRGDEIKFNAMMSAAFTLAALSGALNEGMGEPK